jgi:hypothetical protein
MDVWRIYRLPGDRQWWRIDGFVDGKIERAEVLAWEATGVTKSVETGGNNHPHTWIETAAEPRTLHLHRCECGNVWQHWSDKGNEEVHKCSQCGTLVWQQANRAALAGTGSDTANARAGSPVWFVLLMLAAAAALIFVAARTRKEVAA